MRLERWEKMERTAAAVLFALLLGLSLWALLTGHRLFWLTVFGWPFMLWFIWQVFFEDLLDSAAPPGRTERGLATAWLWFRRIVLAAAAAPFGYIGIRGGLENDSVALLLGLGLCLLSLWVAFFGGGRHKSLTDDHGVHARRKARYKWWP